MVQKVTKTQIAAFTGVLLCGMHSAAYADFKLSSPPPPAPPPVVAPIPEPSGPVSLLPGTAGPVLNGFGGPEPLSQAVMQIVPVSKVVVFGDGVDTTVMVTWHGGKPAGDVLADVAHQVGLVVEDTGPTVIIRRQAGSVAADSVSIAPTVPAEPPPPPAPHWTAKPGDMLKEVLQRWCKEANITLDWDAEFDFRVRVPVDSEGNFNTAVTRLLDGFRESKLRPYGQLHPNKDTGTPALIIKTRSSDYFGE